MAPCGHLALLLDRGVLLGQTASNRRKKVQRIWGLCERGNSPRFENPNSVVYANTRSSGVFVVWLFNPTDVRSMYKAEGSYPSRRSHTALAHLRASQPERSDKNCLKKCRFGEKKCHQVQHGRPLADQRSGVAADKRSFAEASSWLPCCLSLSSR